MEAISGINQRLGEIHSLIASVAPRPEPSAGVQAATGLYRASAPSSLYSSGTTGLFSAGSPLPGLFSGGAAFADIFASMTTQGTSLAAAAAELNADGVPRALAGYGNGKIPESALAAIAGSSQKMWAPAAQHLNELLADAKAAGHSITVTDGYRTYESQVRLAETKGLYREGGLAAVPGTSEHGWGLAVDLGLDPNAQAWMREHAGEYGFVENVPREPWHWEFVPAA